jgi:uncharacterized protein YggE
MKKRFLASIFFIVAISGYSQKWRPFSKRDLSNKSVETISDKTTINISGDASKMYLPDIMVVDFTITAQNIDHKQAIVTMQQTNADLIKRLNHLGFIKEEIKNTSYSVTEDLRYCDGSYNKNGFVATQGIKLEFNVNIEKLSTLFMSFADEPNSKITFNYNTQFSDKLVEKIREELIDTAIKDAKKKADIISQSANLKVVGIKNITYNNIYQNYSSSLNRADMMAVKSSETAKPTLPDISMNETQFTQTVDITFIASQE